MTAVKHPLSPYRRPGSVDLPALGVAVGAKALGEGRRAPWTTCRIFSALWARSWRSISRTTATSGKGDSGISLLTPLAQESRLLRDGAEGQHDAVPLHTAPDSLGSDEAVMGDAVSGEYGGDGSPDGVYGEGQCTPSSSSRLKVHQKRTKRTSWNEGTMADPLDYEGEGRPHALPLHGPRG